MRLVNRAVITLMMVTLAGTAAFGKTKKETVSFDTAVKVNETVVKPGVYDLVFDDQAKELSIRKGNKVIAKTSVRIEKRDKKARNTEVQRRTEGTASELVSVIFSGSDQEVLIGQQGMMAGGNN